VVVEVLDVVEVELVDVVLVLVLVVEVDVVLELVVDVDEVVGQLVGSLPQPTTANAPSVHGFDAYPSSGSQAQSHGVPP
jgi:hypothetical protein